MKSLTSYAILSSLFLALPANAALENWPGNFLIGLSGGAERVFAHSETIMNYLALSNPQYNTDFIQGSIDDGFVGGIFAGYQTGFDGWIFGGEVSAEWHNFKDPQYFTFSDAAGLLGWNAQATVDQHTVIGVTTRIGYQYPNCPYLIPYLRVGVQIYQEEYQVSFEGNPSVYPAFDIISNEQRTYRFLCGIGVEMPIPSCPRFGLRAEYNYLAATKGINAQQNFTDPAGALLALAPVFFSEYKNQAHCLKLSIVLNII